jgi:predicted ester cyclase
VNAAVAELGLNTQIQPNLREYTPNQGMISGISPNGREFNFSVTVNTGIGDPNAIAEAIDQVLIDAVSRGTLRGGATLA